MLLKIDHWANEATPTTAKTEDMKSKIWSFLTPQMIVMDIMAKIPRSKFMYLIIKFVRCSKTSFNRANRLTILAMLIRKIT